MRVLWGLWVDWRGKYNESSGWLSKHREETKVKFGPCNLDSVPLNISPLSTLDPSFWAWVLHIFQCELPHATVTLAAKIKACLKQAIQWTLESFNLYHLHTWVLAHAALLERRMWRGPSCRYCMPLLGILEATRRNTTSLYSGKSRHTRGIPDPFGSRDCSPGRVAQLVGISSCAPKGRGFDPQSERGLEATYRCFSLSPLPFLSLLKSNISLGEDFFFN